MPGTVTAVSGSGSEIPAVVSRYVGAWNDGDLEGWSAAFVDRPRVEYPAGGAVADTRDRLVEGWRRWNGNPGFAIDPISVVPAGSEVALHLGWRGRAGEAAGYRVHVLSIARDGRIAADRSFDQPDGPYRALVDHFDLYERGHEDPALYEQWLRLFTEDCSVEEPVGSQPRVGVMAEAWAASHGPPRRVHLHPVRILGSATPAECASVVEVEVWLADRPSTIVEAIGVWSFVPDGRIAGSRIFVRGDRLGPDAWLAGQRRA